MKSIYNYSLVELEKYFIGKKYKSYRAKQIYDWIYKKKIDDFSSFFNLNKEVINLLKEDFHFEKLEIVKKEEGSDVIKYLLKLEDGLTIECVLMRQVYGLSLCVSSQVGCNMACRFCQSGQIKKQRDLTISEMVLQILTVEKDLEERISHVVIMGIGEPFDNYENIMEFIRIINSPFGLGIGVRHITVSTCGLIPRIKEFINFEIPVNLAISLHAANDKLRSSLMPINKVYPLKDLMIVLKDYVNKTKKRITLEYILIDGINDSQKDALELVKLVKGLNCYINLIPYNESKNISYKRSLEDNILTFYDIIKKEKINVVLRKEFGGEISAACGQLKALEEE